MARDIMTPYPGLRPFKPEENVFFFGQERSVESLFKRLTESHFVAVLGESGCGKSSMVRAGLIPELVPPEGGEYVSWEVVQTRPELNPIHNLAEGLSKLADIPFSSIETEGMLREDPAALIEIVRRTREMRKQQHGVTGGEDSTRFLLFVVDQFEELFAYGLVPEKQDQADEAALYVKLLLRAAEEFEAEIYVLITMRSDFLGQASQFYGLAEKISDGLFLLPRMKRAQCEDAIVRPAETAGVALSQAVVQELLNETEEREDGLPLLQHALRRLWDTGFGRVGSELPSEFLEGPSEDFVKWSLNEHLDDIVAHLEPEERDVAGRLFKLLGEEDIRGRLVRRQTRWRDVKNICTDQHKLLLVVNAFRDESLGRTFLVPSRQEKEVLEDEDKIDISHEVLLRQWDTYAHWLTEEAKDAKQYTWIAESADRHVLLSSSTLDDAAAWNARFQPTASWAERYTGPYRDDLKRHERDFDAAMKFLKVSIWHERAVMIRRWLIAGGVVAVIVLAAIVSTFFFKWESRTTREVGEKVEGAMETRNPIEERAENAAIAHTHSLWPSFGASLERTIALDQWELFSNARGIVLPQKDKTATHASPSAPTRSSSVALDHGEIVALAHDGKIDFTCVATGQPIQAEKKLPRVDRILFSPDGDSFAATIIPDGRSAGAPARRVANKVVHLFNIVEGKSCHISVNEVATGDVTEPVLAMAFLPAAAASDSRANRLGVVTLSGLKLVDASSGKLLNPPTLKLATGAIAGDVIGNSSASPTAERNPGNVVLAAFSPKGTFLVSAYKDGTLYITDLMSGDSPLAERLIRPHVQRQSSSPIVLGRIAVSDEGLVVVGDSSGTLTSQSANDPAGDDAIVVGNLDSSITAIAIGSRLQKPEIAAGSATGAAAIFPIEPRQPAPRGTVTKPAQQNASSSQTETPTSRQITLAHHLTVTWMKFSNDGETIVTGSADGHAREFESRTGIELRRSKADTTVVFADHLGTKWIVASINADLTLGDVANPKIVSRDWQQKDCSESIGMSSVNRSGDVAWNCAGKIWVKHTVGNAIEMREQSASSQQHEEKVQIQTMALALAEDGRSVTWVDIHKPDGAPGASPSFVLHHREVSEPNQDQSIVLGTPSEFTPSADHPLVAISAEGNYVVAVGQDAMKTIHIRRFKTNSMPSKGPWVGNDLPIAAAQHRYARITALAVDREGKVAVGTTGGYLYLSGYSSVMSQWKACKSGAVNNTSSPNDTVALAFSRSAAVEHLIAGFSDGDIQRFKTGDGVKVPGLGLNECIGHVPENPEYIFASEDDPTESLAVTLGNESILFASPKGSGTEQPAEGMILREPGRVEALRFLWAAAMKPCTGPTMTVLTSVSVDKALVEITHHVNLNEYVEDIQGKPPKPLPFWIPERVQPRVCGWLESIGMLHSNLPQ